MSTYSTISTMLEPAGLDTWAALSSKGISNAISGLSQMIGKEVVTTSLRAKRVPVADVASLLGGAEECAVGIYLAIAGSGTGHVLTVYQPQTAMSLVELLLGADTGSTESLGEMEQSALGEVGNVMGSFFLSTLADATSLDLLISPPAVMMDMAGAILDAVLAQILQDTDEALIVETTFGTRDQQMDGMFLVVPNQDLQSALSPHRDVL